MGAINCPMCIAHYVAHLSLPIGMELRHLLAAKVHRFIVLKNSDSKKMNITNPAATKVWTKAVDPKSGRTYYANMGELRPQRETVSMNWLRRVDVSLIVLCPPHTSRTNDFQSPGKHSGMFPKDG